MKDVNEQRDQKVITFARKAMICTNLACNILGRWHVKQLTLELQSIIQSILIISKEHLFLFFFDGFIFQALYFPIFFYGLIFKKYNILIFANAFKFATS